MAAVSLKPEATKIIENYNTSVRLLVKYYLVSQ